MSVTAEQAQANRERLIATYVANPEYSAVETRADGLNHLAFMTRDPDATIDFYTKIVGLKLLRIRPLDGDPRSTMIFFDIGRGELLAFLHIADVVEGARPGVGGIHHFALTIDKEQYAQFQSRADARGLAYRTISHEILTSISAYDPNGIEVELSVWNIDPREMSQREEATAKAA